MVVPPEVSDIGRACKRFLFTTEFAGFLILTFFQNEMTLSIGIRLLIEAILAAYFYLKCSDSSGIPLKVDEEQEISQLSISTQQRDNSQQESYQIPQKYVCQECNIIQPYRTKHCKKCKKCIPKYDHHCFWVGGCIGELNHRTFWLFLYFQCLLCFDALFQFNKQLSLYSIYQEDKENKYQQQYLIILLIGAISFGFGIFTGALLFYHTMLIMTGQTTWEHTQRDKITYLKFYPKFYHPYNYGMFKNIRITFFHKNQQSHWIPPLKDQIQEQCNLFDNKYYSCC
ncbi:unnamed protein product [Paramecium sonneborni]|uniref:Palmitoyltransferase n=1 Tax=Paramecium sonneborni TaxID=65129 RepID=A0A8S1R5J4_9CILI|nr:unnamed protein product [Paramecium sonneborni]